MYKLYYQISVSMVLYKFRCLNLLSFYVWCCMKFHGSKYFCMLITDVCNLKCHLKTFIYFYTVNLFDTAFSFAYFLFLLFYAFMCLFCTTLSFALCSVHVLFVITWSRERKQFTASLRELIINKFALFEPPPYHTTRIYIIYIIHDFTSF